MGEGQPEARLRLKPILVAAGATVASLGSLLTVDGVHNAMSWHPQGLCPETVIALAVYGLALWGVAWASAESQSRLGFSVVLGLAVMVLLAGLMGIAGEHGSEIKPRTPSPVVYRATKAVLMALPLVLVVFNASRQQREGSVHGVKRDL